MKRLLCLLLVSLLVYLPVFASTENPREIFERHRQQAEGLKGEKALTALEDGYLRLVAQKDKVLWASFAGAMAAMRCRHVEDANAKLRYLADAFPLLDRSVRKAKADRDPKVQLIALMNRAEVYAVLPSLFKKSEIAQEDARQALQIARQQKLEAEAARMERLLVRLKGDK